MELTAIEQRLQAIGELPGDKVPLFETLGLMAAMEDPNADLAQAEQHMTAMRQALAAIVSAAPHFGEGGAQYRLARLKAVVINQFGYKGDSKIAVNLEGINFFKSIQSRRGDPVLLGALYLDLAQSQHWPATGLNFPGHFLLRIDHGPERLIIDPFNDGKVMEAHDLRQLLKSMAGDKAELNHHYYDPVSNRDVVLRFCNSRKSLFIAQSNYASALTVIGHELWVAPNEPRLYYDAAILCAKIGRINEALEALHHFIGLSKDPREIVEAKNLIRSLQLGLH